MKRTQICFFILLALVAGANVLAQEQENGESVRVISTRNIKEKLDGADAAVTIVEVTIGPGQAGLPHRHPGPGFVYVLEGEYELGVENQPTKRFKAGDTFYEPTGCLHSVSKNPSAKGRTRLIAVVVHPRDAKEIAIPEAMNQSHAMNHSPTAPQAGVARP